MAAAGDRMAVLEPSHNDVLRTIKAVAEANGVDPLSKVSVILGAAEDALRREASTEVSPYSADDREREALAQIVRVVKAPPRTDRAFTARWSRSST